MLSRYVMLAAFPVALVIGGRFCYRTFDHAAARSDAPACDQRPASEQSLEEISQALNDLRARRDAFAQLVSRLADELASNKIGLAGARDSVFYFCLQNYPEHLENLAMAEAGADIKLIVARHLVDAVRARVDPPTANAQASERMARVERELRELECGEVAFN